MSFLSFGLIPEVANLRDPAILAKYLVLAVCMRGRRPYVFSLGMGSKTNMSCQHDTGRNCMKSQEIHRLPKLWDSRDFDPAG